MIQPLIVSDWSHTSQPNLEGDIVLASSADNFRNTEKLKAVRSEISKEAGWLMTQFMTFDSVSWLMSSDNNCQGRKSNID